MTEVYLISSQIYYESPNNCYKRIITIDRTPNGPLSSLTRRINNPKLSPYQTSSSCARESCVLALYSQTTNEVLDISNQGTLLTFLYQNDYTIDTELTNVMRKQTTQNNCELLFVIKYTAGGG